MDEHQEGLLKLSKVSVKEYVTPSGITDLYLHRCQIEILRLTNDIETCHIEKSSVKKIIFRNEMEYLYCPNCRVCSIDCEDPTQEVNLREVDIRNNMILAITFKLKKSHVFKFRMNGNEYIKIKYLDFLCDAENPDILCVYDHDIFTTPKKQLHFHEVWTLIEMIKQGITFIDLDALGYRISRLMDL